MTPTAIHEELSAPAYRGDLCDLLEHMRELVETARSMPLSNSAIVNRDEVLELLDETMERLPEELRQARWLLKEREEYLERARREADEIVAAAWRGGWPRAGRGAGRPPGGPGPGARRPRPTAASSATRRRTTSTPSWPVSS